MNYASQQFWKATSFIILANRKKVRSPAPYASNHTRIMKSNGGMVEGGISNVLMKFPAMLVKNWTMQFQLPVVNCKDAGKSLRNLQNNKGTANKDIGTLCRYAPYFANANGCGYIWLHTEGLVFEMTKQLYKDYVFDITNRSIISNTVRIWRICCWILFRNTSIIPSY